MTMHLRPSPTQQLICSQKMANPRQNAALLAVQIMASVLPYTAFPPVSLIT